MMLAPLTESCSDMCQEIRGSSAGLTDTQISTFVEAWTALGASPVHGPHPPAVRRLVADPKVDTREN